MNEPKDDSRDAENTKNSANGSRGASGQDRTNDVDRAENSSERSSEKARGADKGVSGDTYESTRPQNSPPIREHRVEEARQKMENGAYDSPEIRDAIVERLVDAFTG